MGKAKAYIRKRREVGVIKEIIGDCVLYLGDCMEVMQEIGNADSVITDPPYKMEIHGRGFAAKRDYYSRLDYGTATDFELSPEFYNLLLSKLNEKNMTFFCNKLMKLDIENWAVGMGFTFDELVMCKSAPSPLTNNQWLPDKEFAVHVFRQLAVRGNYNTKRTWFLDANYQDKTVDHPSVKPIYILQHIIQNVSDIGQIVLDPFMGSGTTGVACVKMGRNFIGIEREKKYFDISCNRIKESYAQDDMFSPQLEKHIQHSFNIEKNAS